jgi:hypothetical protein
MQHASGDPRSIAAVQKDTFVDHGTLFVMRLPLFFEASSNETERSLSFCPLLRWNVTHKCEGLTADWNEARSV